LAIWLREYDVVGLSKTRLRGARFSGRAQRRGLAGRDRLSKGQKGVRKIHGEQEEPKLSNLGLAMDGSNSGVGARRMDTPGLLLRAL